MGNSKIAALILYVTLLRKHFPQPYPIKTKYLQICIANCLQVDQITMYTTFIFTNKKKRL